MGKINWSYYTVIIQYLGSHIPKFYPIKLPKMQQWYKITLKKLILDPS